MSTFEWCTNRCGGILLIGLLVICIWAITNAAVAQTARWTLPGIKEDVLFDLSQNAVLGSSFFEHFFAYYSVLTHAVVVGFQLRVCWAIRQSVLKLQLWLSSSSTQSRKSSLVSLVSSSSRSSFSQSSSDLESWDSTTDFESECSLLTHAILLPNYKEDLHVLDETLTVLAAHPQARDAYDIYLAMEEREVEAKAKAEILISKFEHRFKYITATFHPSDLVGEAAGKSSNLSWAAGSASRNYSPRHDVILTSIDSDSHLSWKYFSEITSLHLASETPSSTLYAAPIIFDRNAHLVPGLVSIADILWAAAGISGHYDGSAICPPTSVYSIPLELADRVGGWDTGPSSIGEDLHMYLKCFFALNGHLVTKTVANPVSQTNVSGSGGNDTLRGQLQSIHARYRQALRHMYGSLDTGFALQKIAEVWQRRGQATAISRPLHEWDSANKNTTGSEIYPVSLQSPDWIRIALLLHRLFEAHFLPTHMTFCVIFTTLLNLLTSPSPGLAWTYTLTSILQPLHMVGLLIYFLYYQTHHHLAVTSRFEEMKSAGLVERMGAESFSYRSWKCVGNFIWIPLVAPLYGSIPAVHAQICHLFGVELVYVVSRKPGRAGEKSD